MRRLIILLCVMLLTLGVTAPVSAHQRSDDGNDTDSFTLWATETYFALVAPDGTVIEDPEEEEFLPEVGSQFFSIDTLYSDEERTDEVGANRVSCEVIRSGGETEEDFFVDLLCDGVVTLEDRGDLTWQARVSFTADEVDTEEPFAMIALTGGTEEFIGAGGEVAVFDETAEDDAEATLSRYEITLLPGG